MKKSYIIVAVLLLASLAGTYAVYVRYVQPMSLQLVAHEKEAELLGKKIKELEVLFQKTVPEEIIRQWQEGKQPWINASKARAAFFQLEDIAEIEIPEGVIPRFWYIDEFPKMEESLFEEALEKKIVLGNINFDILPPSSFEGKNPSAEEILEQVNKYKYGIEMTRIIFDANPARVDEVRIWPQRPAVMKKSGSLETRTIGYRITISFEDLLKFLQKLKSSENYVTVDGIRLSSKNLRFQKGLLDVELVLSQANFDSEKVAGAEPGIGTGSSDGFTLLDQVVSDPNREVLSYRPEPSQYEGFFGYFRRLFGF